jgi:hypothetical protein
MSKEFDAQWWQNVEETRKRAIANGKVLDISDEEQESFSSSRHYFDECYHLDSVPCSCLKDAYEAWQSEQAMQALDARLSVEEIDDLAWDTYQRSEAVPGACLCGNVNCRGLRWILDGNDPFEMLEVDL